MASCVHLQALDVALGIPGGVGDVLAGLGDVVDVLAVLVVVELDQDHRGKNLKSHFFSLFDLILLLLFAALKEQCVKIIQT